MVDERGEKVVGANVAFFDRPRPRSVTLRDSNGFEFAGVAAGSWPILVRKAGFAWLEDEVDITGMERVVEYRATLTPNRKIAVFATTPSGESLNEHLFGRFGGYFSGLSAVLAQEKPIVDLPSVTGWSLSVFDDGRFRRPPSEERRGARVGTIETSKSRNLFVSLLIRTTVLAWQPLPLGESSVRFVVSEKDIDAQLATVRVRAVSADGGEPITTAKASITARTARGRWRGCGPDGRIEYRGIIPGWVEILVTAAGCETISRQIELHPGRVTDLGDVPLTGNCVVSGRALDVDVEPIFGLSMFFVDPDELSSHPGPIDTSMGVCSNRQGRFKLDWLGSRRYAIFHTSKDHAKNPAYVDVTGPVHDVGELTFRRGTEIVFSVSISRDRRVMCVFRDAGKRVVWVEIITNRFPRTIRLVPGRYSVEVFEDEGRMTYREFEVRSSPLRIDLSSA